MQQRMFNLVAAMIVTTVAMTLALLGLDSGIVPFVLGLPLALFLPGYALTSVFAPRSLNHFVRLLLSVGISIAVTATGRVLLGFIPWGLQFTSWTIYLGSITITAAVVALLGHRDPLMQPAGRKPTALRQLIPFGMAGAIATALAVVSIGTLQQPDTALAQFLFASGAQAAPATPMHRETTGAASTTLPTITDATPTPVPTPILPTPVPATVAEAITPTAAPLPTATIVVETSTPSPSPSPTAVPTATATMPAASPPPQPSDTLAADRLDIALSDWPSRTTDTASLSYDDGQYRLTLDGQPSVSISSVLPADEYRLSIDMALETGEAGVIFLAVEPVTFYRIMFNTEGAYSIQRIDQDNDVSTIVDWTASTAVESSEDIRVRIQRQGNTIQFFANDQPLTVIDVPDGRVTNQVGVVLADSSEQGQVTFTDLVVEQLSNQ